jgi:hypothetical protein
VAATQRTPRPPHQPNQPTLAAHLPVATEKATQRPSRNTARPIPGAAATARPSPLLVDSIHKATTPPSPRTNSASVLYESLPRGYRKHFTNIQPTGCRCRPWMRHVLEAHNQHRQFWPQSQQRGQQHRCHGHQPMPSARQPAVLAVRSPGDEPVRREPQLRSLH